MPVNRAFAWATEVQVQVRRRGLTSISAIQHG
jgi:hypothetical protein